jgi:hypothetical protein
MLGQRALFVVDAWGTNRTRRVVQPRLHSRHLGNVHNVAVIAPKSRDSASGKSSLLHVHVVDVADPRSGSSSPPDALGRMFELADERPAHADTDVFHQNVQKGGK